MSSFGKAFYHTIGGAVLDHLVPTAASAGLIVLILNSIRVATTNVEADLWFAAGWFAAVLFTVSVSQGMDQRQGKALDVFLDVGEAIAMVYAFVSLGLVDQSTRPLWHFYAAVLAYLVMVLVRRRFLGSKRPDDDRATPWITALTLVICVLLAAAIPVSARQWFDGVDVLVISALWVALAIYLVLALWREMRWPPPRAPNRAASST
jgi:hypothetical protein